MRLAGIFAAFAEEPIEVMRRAINALYLVR